MNVIALSLGLVAAIAWGIHDICVRFVTQSTSVYSALLIVLVAGSVFQFSFLIINGSALTVGSSAMPMISYSGAAFIVASIGLYKAFEIGPVRLVAPIIASYPAISVSIAAINGNPVTIFQGLAVIFIISGVGIVASLSDQSGQETNPDADSSNLKKQAILWAIVSAVGFSTSFAFGHAATEFASELPVTLFSRVVAIVLLLILMFGLRISPTVNLRQLPILLMMGLMDAIAHASVISAGRMDNAEYSAVAASTFGMVTILLAWFFLKEPIGRTQWVGVLMVFTGIGYLAGSNL